MKFGKIGQVGLVSAIAVGVATLFTACGTLTVDFLFVPTNRLTIGQVEVYEVNSLSGALRTIPTSPFPSGGRNPIADAVSPDAKNLYVVNGDDNNIAQFTIGSDGKLYPQSTINTPGTFPVALAVNGGFAFVLDTLAPIAGCTLTNPCPGAVAAYAITPGKSTVSPGSLGLAPAGCSANPLPSGITAGDCTVGNAIVDSNGLTYLPQPDDPVTGDVLTPTALHVLANGSAMYVTAYDSVTSQGFLFGYSVASTGALTPWNNGAPYSISLSGTSNPVAMASDSTASHLYVADKLGNRILTYALKADGSLPTTTAMVNHVTVAVATSQSAASTGNQPTAMTMNGDQFLYVTNGLDSTINGYTVSSGNLSRIDTWASDTNPVALIVDPRRIGFLYTVNFLGNSLSGYQINSTTGALINTQMTPYPSAAQPTAITGIPHSGQVR